MTGLFELDELELDLLAELFNIGVGKAANSLSQMVDQEIKLSVPSIDFKTVSQMTGLLGDTTCMELLKRSRCSYFRKKAVWKL